LKVKKVRVYKEKVDMISRIIKPLKMRKKMRLAVVMGAFGAMLLWPIAASANLLVDGSFETPIASQPFQTFGTGALGTAWTVTAGSVDLIGNYWQTAQGSQSVDMSGNENGTISQTINLAPGTYKLIFDESGNPDGPPTLKQLNVSLGGGTPQEFDYTIGSNTHDNMQWVIKTAYFTVAGGPAALVFSDISSGIGVANPVGPAGTTPWGAALDNVSLVAVPEASTMIAGALLLLPFGASTLRILRRNRRM
jgi:choice-of-anchor C domain-containing protein